MTLFVRFSVLEELQRRYLLSLLSITKLKFFASQNVGGFRNWNSTLKIPLKKGRVKLILCGIGINKRLET
jgi:hypothetical protein